MFASIAVEYLIQVRGTEIKIAPSASFTLSPSKIITKKVKFAQLINPIKVF